MLNVTIEEIIKGESKNIEFKEALPEKSIKYMKSVVAFANGLGGKIIFGIADKTHEVVGVDNTDIFKTIDAIANAISDSCEPAIIPDITLQTINGKTIIVVEIDEGRQRPYYIKALGRDSGVYVRVAGTTRLADYYMIKELLFEGENRCFDQALYSDIEVSEAEINNLCQSMKHEAVKNAHSPEQKASIRDVTKQQLLSWGVLIRKNDKLYPANAFAVLNGDMLCSVTQCGVFKGDTKAIFVDRREYHGPIWEQIEEAYQFVLRNIHMGAKFAGLYRQDVYEIPPDAIRELIINAAVHRSYLDHNSIQVAIYDNRLEITSPGKLPMGQNLERMQEGYSRIRNEALAYAFAYMNLIEHWGSGFPRIIQKLKDASLKAPELIGGDVDLRINVYRPQNTIQSDLETIQTNKDTIQSDLETIQTDKNIIQTNKDTIQSNGRNLTDSELLKKGFSEKECRILQLLFKKPDITQKGLAFELGYDIAQIKYYTRKLKQKGVISRIGTSHKGIWKINLYSLDIS